MAGSSLFDHLKVFLRSQAGVNALVGTNAAARIYLDFAKQNAARPYLVLQMFPGEAAQSIHTRPNYANARVQIDAYADSSSAAYALAEAVRDSLEHTRNEMSDGTNTIRTSTDSLGSYQFGSEERTSGSKDRLYWCSRDYEIWHAEEVT